MESFQLLHQIFHDSAGRKKQIAVEPFPIAVDFAFLDDLLCLIDRGNVTVRMQPRAFFAQEFFDVVITVVDRIDQMRGGASGHSPADWTVVDQHYVAPFAREQVGGRDTRYSTAYDTNVGR